MFPPLGLGRLGRLSDELVLQVLSSLSGPDLVRLAATSRAFYVYCNHEELWRSLTLQVSLSTALALYGNQALTTSHNCPWTHCSETGIRFAQIVARRLSSAQELEGKFKFRQSWQTTYLQATQPDFAPTSRQRSRSFKGLYSDVLFQPHFCATIPLHPSWLESNNVDRRSGLSVLDFREQYEVPNKPVIITDIVSPVPYSVRYSMDGQHQHLRWPALAFDNYIDCPLQVSKWPAFQKWERAYLQRAFSKSPVVVGSYEMLFEDFLAYCDESRDDMPLYLFDKHFAKRAPELAADFEVSAVSRYTCASECCRRQKWPYAAT